MTTKIILSLLEIIGALLREIPTKQDLEEIRKTIMSAVSDYAAKVTAHLDKIDGSISGISEDVRVLNETIQKLQTSPGPLSPEDQKLLDDLEARAKSAADKLAAVDDLTPPPAPPATT